MFRFDPSSTEGRFSLSLWMLWVLIIFSFLRKILVAEKSRMTQSSPEGGCINIERKTFYNAARIEKYGSSKARWVFVCIVALFLLAQTLTTMVFKMKIQNKLKCHPVSN